METRGIVRAFGGIGQQGLGHQSDLPGGTGNNPGWRRKQEGQETRNPLHPQSEKDLLGHKL